MVDIESLLQPLSPDPVGPNLRFEPADATFAQIDDARAEYDAATSPSGQEKEADWRAVVRIASEALRERSKDLELVSFLAEGLARTEGFGGLSDGIKLALESVRRYWKKIHPGQEPGGEINLAVHLKPLSVIGSGREFLTAVQKIPIVLRPGKNPLGWYEYTMSRRSPGGVDEASRMADTSRYQAYLAQGYVTSADWRAGLKASPPDDLRMLAADVEACRAGLAELMGFFRDRVDAEKTPDPAERIDDDATPNFLPLRDMLDDLVEVILAAAGPEEAEAVGVSDPDPADDSGGGTASVAVKPGGLNSRADALRQLDVVAEYLHRTDPHSPVAFLVKRAVRWGNMPLEQVLAEVLQNDDSLAKIRETLGIQGDGQGEA